MGRRIKNILILLLLFVSLQGFSQDSAWTKQDSIKYENIVKKVKETMEMYKDSEYYEELIIVMSDMIFNREEELILNKPE